MECPWGWKGASDLQIDGQTVQVVGGGNQWRCAALATPCPFGKKQVSEIRVHERVNEMQLGVVKNDEYRTCCAGNRSVSFASDHARGINLNGDVCTTFRSQGNLPTGAVPAAVPAAATGFSFGSSAPSPVNLPNVRSPVNIQTGDVLTIEIDLKSKTKSVQIRKGTTILGVWSPLFCVCEHLTVVVGIHSPRGAFSCLSSEIPVAGSWEPTHPLWLPDTRQSLRQSVASFVPRASAVPKVNVLLVGGPGAGKSSLVNSIYSALEGEMVRLAARGTGAGTITTRLTKYDFDGLVAPTGGGFGGGAQPATPGGTFSFGQPASGAAPFGAAAADGANKASPLGAAAGGAAFDPAPTVAIWDSAGWTDDTYKHGTLNYVLGGHLPDGFELDQRHIDDRSPGFRPSPVAGDYMHVVLIAVPYEELSNESYLARARSGVPRPSRAAAARSPAPRAGARLSRPRASSRLDASRAADQGRSRVGGSGRGSQDPVSLRRDP